MWKSVLNMKHKISKHFGLISFPVYSYQESPECCKCLGSYRFSKTSLFWRRGLATIWERVQQGGQCVLGYCLMEEEKMKIIATEKGKHSRALRDRQLSLNFAITTSRSRAGFFSVTNNLLRVKEMCKISLYRLYTILYRWIFKDTFAKLEQLLAAWWAWHVVFHQTETSSSTWLPFLSLWHGSIKKQTVKAWKKNNKLDTYSFK
jgi:hypothetical protein